MKYKPDSVTTLIINTDVYSGTLVPKQVMRWFIHTFVQVAKVLNPWFLFNQNTWGNICVMTSNLKKSVVENVWHKKCVKPKC